MKRRDVLARFLDEDIAKGDITSELLEKKKIRARIVSRECGIVAGVVFAKEIFALKRCKCRILAADGSRIRVGQPIMEISGQASSVLSCERTALNLLSRMSGIATSTNSFVRKIRAANKKVDLYSTRKTAPGLRFFDKEAVKIGGGKKHRIALSDMIMIKDNHIAVEGSLERLIERAKRKSGQFEVEVEDEKDAILAAQMGAGTIMLDNFTVSEIKHTIQSLKRMGLRNSVRLEASGGINSKNIANYAKSGVDMISVGQITNSVKAIDFSLEV